MTNLNKLLIALFVILLLVVGIEAGYYFIYQPKKQQAVSQVNTTSPTKQPTSNNTGNTVQPLTIIPVNDPQRAISYNALRFLASLKKGILTESTLNNRYQGTLTEIDLKGGQLPKGFPYKVSLVITGDNKFVNTFYFKEEVLKTTKVTALVNGKEQPINLSDLKTGDKISIQQAFGLISTSEPKTTIIKL